MKTLLIVEDEGTIRQGLCAMAQRAPVAIEEILSCGNGVEAMEILRNAPVDAMITDIRMPKMDGIALLERAVLLPEPPLTAVLSGYDDFSYAVSMFRQGAFDYVLKPVERETFFALLSKMEDRIQNKKQRAGSLRAFQKHMLRSILLGTELSEEDARSLRAGCGETFLQQPYAVICLPYEMKILAETENIYSMLEMEGHEVFVALLEKTEEQESLSRRDCAGICRCGGGPEGLRETYRRAVMAREFAFVRGETVDCTELLEADGAGTIPEGELEKGIQLLGASRVNEAVQWLEHLIFSVQNNEYTPSAYAEGIARFAGEIRRKFGGFLLTDEEELHFGQVWRWNSAYDHFKAFSEWLQCKFAAGTEEDEEDSCRKIQLAVEYMHQNFRSDVNMAVVSNYVSMNYTQFSHLFKKFTGCNFLDYLKELRLSESKKLLRQDTLGIREISKKVGFKNEKHFMKSFKSQVGVSPGVYRKNCAKWENAAPKTR